MTTPRSYPDRWKDRKRAAAKAQEQSTRDGAVMLLVLYDGRIWVRGEKRGKAMCAKHKKAKVLERIEPGTRVVDAG
jgi:hypothetical protein